MSAGPASHCGRCFAQHADGVHSAALSGQPVAAVSFGRLARHNDVNDADRMALDPVTAWS